MWLNIVGAERDGRTAVSHRHGKVRGFVPGCKLQCLQQSINSQDKENPFDEFCSRSTSAVSVVQDDIESVKCIPSQSGVIQGVQNIVEVLKQRCRVATFCVFFQRSSTNDAAPPDIGHLEFGRRT